MAANTRIMMLGTGDFALPTFRKLLDDGRNVVALVTQPDRPQGRKQELIPSRIKQEALARGVPVLQPESVNSLDAIAALREYQPEILVTAAYGQILSPELLALPLLGGINLHGSILPAYRGAAPVARAIENGETETGVTVIRMTPRIDAGGMISIARTPIDPDETAGELEDRLAELGAPVLADALDAVVAGAATFLKQEKARVTRASKLRKEDGVINWRRPAQVIHNLVRAMQPWPKAQTVWHSREVGKPPCRLIVHKTHVDARVGDPGVVLEVDKDGLVIAASDGAVRLLVIQIEGKRALPASEFTRGNRVLSGDRMGD
jgi:methionyl-tRNA formyltransferase